MEGFRMKRNLFTMLVLALAVLCTGCGNESALQEQIQNLQSENESLKNELQTYKNNEEAEKEKQIKIEEEKSKYKQIKLNEVCTVDGYGEFAISSYALAQKIEPPNPTSFYTYYEVKDPAETYLDIVLNFKNTSTIGINADEITNMKVIYGDGYEYSTFSTIEESGGTNFTYSNITKVEPLKSANLHYIATLPVEAKSSSEPIKVQFSIYGYNYEISLR